MPNFVMVDKQANKIIGIISYANCRGDVILQNLSVIKRKANLKIIFQKYNKLAESLDVDKIVVLKDGCPNEYKVTRQLANRLIKNTRR